MSTPFSFAENVHLWQETSSVKQHVIPLQTRSTWRKCKTILLFEPRWPFIQMPSETRQAKDAKPSAVETGKCDPALRDSPPRPKQQVSLSQPWPFKIGPQQVPTLPTAYSLHPLHSRCVLFACCEVRAWPAASQVYYFLNPFACTCGGGWGYPAIQPFFSL